ncbi:MAG: C4-type zinc ribbon domain-containing protein [candidate division WOR-3 bacterium]
MEDVYEIFQRIGQIEERIENNRIKMGDKPFKRKELKEQLDAIISKIENLKKEKEKLVLENKEIEQKVLVLRDKIEEDKKYLSNVKSNDEYMMISEGIKHKKDIISQSEDRILKNLSDIEKLENEIKKLEQENSTMEKIKKEIEEINNIIKDIEEENEKLNVEREKLVSSLPEEYQKKYQKIYEKKKKRAVILINEPYCLGCYSSIPAQLFDRVKSMKKIEFCINCGRIILFKKDENCNKF